MLMICKVVVFSMFCGVDMFIVCACSTDNIIDLFVCGGQIVSLCDGHICDCIVFDV